MRVGQVNRQGHLLLGPVLFHALLGAVDTAVTRVANEAELGFAV